ncbi:hypothetical protein M3G91_04065 [Micromonospora chalcea]|uniref:hypothetical protein n=1 Tax=Micromonospora chalcea TaxID=1874 RepID=UPI0021A62586|nr:hypothetical protein [Micromonospora chalcea]MCT2276788.1 hypothetical protein [Micromonospora chalcea]
MPDLEPTEGDPSPEARTSAPRSDLSTLLALLVTSAVLLALCLGCAAFWLYN